MDMTLFYTGIRVVLVAANGITHTKFLLGEGKALLRERVLKVGNFLVTAIEQPLGRVGA